MDNHNFYQNRIFANEKTGLTSEQVLERRAAGLYNEQVKSAEKTTAEIIKSNVFTYFNLVFFVLALCVALTGSYNDLMFFPVIVINTVIGICQEIRSKKTLEKLTILSVPKASAVRDGKEVKVSVGELVRDDIVIFCAGDQICADATVISGTAQLNEALVTGENIEIKKEIGSNLLSGSFVVSGRVYARLDNVGKDSFVSRLTLEAKKKNNNKKSEMMNALDNLVKWIGILIIPIGILMLINQVYILHTDYKSAVVSTVGALVGMIPEGLYLLTTAALVVSVMRLAKGKTLVHEMGCIEALARVNVLCVDKTGTITEDKMEFSDMCILDESMSEDEISDVLCDFCSCMDSDNATIAALKAHFNGGGNGKNAEKAFLFSSAKKYSAVNFSDNTSYILGAPEIIMKDNFCDIEEAVNKYHSKRVLLLAEHLGAFDGENIGDEIVPVALITISNKIRDNAAKTFGFFKSQGVKIKVISGDNPKTVSEVAKAAGIEDAENYVDARELESDGDFTGAVRRFTVFGRVTPEKKRKLIIALKNDGNTVAMTGDGVNDVLALKEADCSIAMASGSDVASQVSQLVLLNSDFTSLPGVVKEGRRVINNIERTAALFLVKNIFSFFFALISIIFSINYPVMPSQLTLVSTATIGIPAFFLALLPNSDLVKGKFMRNVIYKAFPAGFTNIILVSYLSVLAQYANIGFDEMSTMVTFVLGVVGLTMLYRVCKPFNRFRKILWIGMTVLFFAAAFVLPNVFTLSRLSVYEVLLLILFVALVQPFMYLVVNILEFFEKKYKNRKA